MLTSKLYKASLKGAGGKKYHQKAVEIMRLAEQLTEIGFTEYPEPKLITEGVQNE